MKTGLLANLRCTQCHGAHLELTTVLTNDLEIRDGAVACQACGHAYAIADGILDTLGDLHGDIRAERDGWEQLAARDGWLVPTDEYLRQLPDPEVPLPGDDITWEIHAANFRVVLDSIEWVGKDVVDIGAGRCWSTKHITLQGAKCVAVDVVAHPGIGLGAAGVLIEDESMYFDRVLGDMVDLPFSDARFDVAFFTGALHHSTSLRLALTEVHRVLRPGGCLAMTNEACGAIFSREVAYDPTDATRIHEHKYRLSSYRAALKAAGFGQVRIMPDTTFVHGTARSWKLGSVNAVFRRLPLRRLSFLVKQYLFGGPLLLVAVRD